MDRKGDANRFSLQHYTMYVHKYSYEVFLCLIMQYAAGVHPDIQPYR